MKTKKRGGKRSKAGRKPILDKKIAITVYLRKSKVDELGGADKVRQSILNMLE